MPAQRVPTRGRYDRSSSASERAQQQHDVLLAAALDLLSQTNPRADLSISALCEATGMGRNTVYGHFDSSAAIADTVIDSCLAKARNAVTLSYSVAPLSAASEFVDAWLEFATQSPEQLLVAARWSRNALLNLVGEAVADLLETGRHAGLFAPDPGDLRARLLAAAAIEAAQHVAAHPDELPLLRGALLDVVTRCAR